MNLDVLDAELAAARALATSDWPAAARALRQMVLTRGLLITDDERLLAIDGVMGPHTLAAPLVVHGRTAATVVVYADTAENLPAALVRHVTEWAGRQLERASPAPRLLQGQISPHFFYGAVSSIYTLVRTDPEQALALLRDFADHVRSHPEDLSRS